MIQHGHSGKRRSPTWLSWRAARQRCNDAGHSDFARYGGRGIRMDSAWDSFAQFLADMGPRPAGTTLDRRDPNGPYTAENCRWATPSEQAKNRRRPPNRDQHGRFAELNHAHATRMGG